MWKTSHPKGWIFETRPLWEVSVSLDEIMRVGPL